MTLLALLLILSGVTLLPFFMTGRDDARRRFYLALSPAPAVFTLLLLLPGINAYTVFMLTIIFALPASFALAMTGAVLTVYALHRGGAWKGLAAGTAPAGSPLAFYAALIAEVVLSGKL